MLLLATLPAWCIDIALVGAWISTRVHGHRVKNRHAAAKSDKILRRFDEAVVEHLALPSENTVAKSL
jgi:hypothetical protein